MALAKVDSKGTVSLPVEIREILGDTVEIVPLGKEKVLLSRSKKGAVKKMRANKKSKDLVQLLETEPRRTGKPENPSPERMKAIWE